MAEQEKFTYDTYTGKDGTPVVHVQTPAEWDGKRGPEVRIYLNDEIIYEGVELEKPERTREEMERL